jgi:hypothetical protein
MFIDTALNPATRAPEERNVSGDEYSGRLRSAPLEREESLELAFL